MLARPRTRRSVPTTPRAASLLGRLVALALSIVALSSSAGCFRWQPLEAFGEASAERDQKLTGKVIRYRDFGEPTELRVVEARSPLVLVPVRGAPRDPYTGERPKVAVDLRSLEHVEVRTVDRTKTIVLVTSVSAAAGAVIGLAAWGIVESKKNRGSSGGSSFQINWGSYD